MMLRKRWFIAGAVAAALASGGFLAGQSAEAERKNKFHADVAHALLEMHGALSEIAEYRAKGSMPPNKDELHGKVAHGFKHALELWGVKHHMPHRK